jgi:hypothetical protein
MEDRSNIKLVGNTTTGQNLGTGAGVFKCKTNGNNLQFKSISVTGSSLSIISGSTTITISGSTSGGNGTITGGTNGLMVFGKNIVLGGIFTGATLINATGGKLKYSTHPLFTNDTEIIDKKYADTIALGLSPKLAVEVATVGNIILSGLTTIDGILTTTGMRVLVKDQLSDQTNGIYSANTGSWSRVADFNVSGETVQGSLIPVISGNTNKNTLWVLVTNNPIIPNITPMIFSYFSGSIFIAGNSINISGSTISVDISTGTLINVLTGATNGLTTIGRNINLGGTIISPIAITGSSKIILGAIGRNIISDPTGSTVCLGGTNNYIFTKPTGTSINSGSGNLNLISNNICVCGANMKYYLHPTFTGSTQIVDKKYVDDKTSGCTTYSLTSPSTCTVGGLIAGSSLTGCGLDKILEEILAPYIAPTFSSFSTTGISATIEVGCQISGSKSFSFGFTNAGNICATSLSIRDVTLGSNIASGCSISSPQSAGITLYNATTCGQQQSWCGCARNTCGTCFGSVAYTTIAYLPYYWGICTCAGGAGCNRPIGSGINVTGGTKVLANSSGSISITFNSGSNDYLWFAVPATVSKVCWCTPSAPTNNGVIGGGINPACNLFPAPNVVSLTSACWAGKSYNVYVSNAQTSVVIPMALT